MKLTIGSMVTLHDFNSDKRVTVRVDSIGEKNGRPLIGYSTPEGGDSWCYFSEIERVNTYAPHYGRKS